MIQPSIEDVGRRVLYTPPGDESDWHRELGIVTSWNDLYVHVQFAPVCVSKACSRSTLTWESDLEGRQNYLDKFVGAYVLREDGVDVSLPDLPR